MTRRNGMLRLAPPPAGRRKKKGSGKRIIRTGLLLIMLGLLIYYGQALFLIKQVVVNGTYRLEPSEVIAASGIREGTSILLIRKKSAAERLMLLPSVSSASVTRHLPATIVIEIREREPAAYLVCGERFWLLDREGVVFDTAKSFESSLPVVTGVPDDEIAAGQPLRCLNRAAALKTFLAVLGELPELNVAELNLEDPYSMLLYTVGGKKILLGSSEKMGRKLELVCRSLPHLAGTAAGALLDVRTGDHLVIVSGSNPGPGEVLP